MIVPSWLPVCAVLAWSASAWAQPTEAPPMLEACVTESLGPWRGRVLDENDLYVLDSEFHLAPDGTPVGTYHIEHGPNSYDGTLTEFRSTAACEADFTWTDKYGAGVVHIRFEPSQGRFLGLWGIDVPLPGQIFDGYRSGPGLTS